MKILHYVVIVILLVLSTASYMQLHVVGAAVPLTMITIRGGANSPSCGNSCITPQNVTVERGTAVQWINNDLVPHFIVSGNSGENDNGSLFNSGSILVGSNFIHDFNDVGVFHYFDPTYTWDTSTINVTNDTFLVYSSQSTPVSSQSNEELAKKIANARDTIANLMINGTGDIPFNEVGVIEKNMTLDVGIDSTKATLSEEQYLEKIKAIVGDIPIKITFGVIRPTANMTSNSEGNSFSKLILSPLQQFRLGFASKDVTCSNSFLIFKAEDNSPACVTIETGKNLVMRGWATEFSIGKDYWTSCNTPYPQSDSGIAVLYMPTNSIGKICVRYYNVNNTPTNVGINIFEANNMTQNATEITHWTYDNTLQGNEIITIAYFIKTGNKTGFYGLAIPSCGGFPFAVGYDANSTITASDFPWAGKVFHCGVITYDYHIESTEGIGVRYIPYSGMP